MDPSTSTISEHQIVKLSLNVALRLTLAAFLLIWCFSILRPFLIPVMWAIILAVALKGVFERMVRMVGGRRGLAATLFALLGIALVVYPSYKVGGSLVGSIQGISRQIESGTLDVPPPPERLQNVPGIGERLYDAWMLSNTNVQQAAVQLEPQLRAFGSWLLGFLAGIGGTVVTTVLALVIAAVLLNFADPAVKMLRALMARIQGDWEEDLVGMAGLTINSVARGVLGVALIQSALCAIGLFAAGVPAAGLFTIGILVLAIIQLPPLILMIIPIVWAWGNLATVWALVFTIYSIVASASDTPLKAVFLARGAVVPMPVVLLGAIGGMVSMGMMGLFLGAIVLSVGYKIVVIWMNDGSLPDPVAAEAVEA